MAPLPFNVSEEAFDGASWLVGPRFLPVQQVKIGGTMYATYGARKIALLFSRASVARIICLRTNKFFMLCVTFSAMKLRR